MLALEDVHWADPTKLDLLRGIAERGALAPLFVLITARPEFRPGWGMRSHHGMVALAPLDREQVRHMVGELAARHVLPKQVVESVTERTGGVPLFVEEGRDSCWSAASRVALKLSRRRCSIVDGAPRPARPAREVAQIASVIGRDFS